MKISVVLPVRLRNQANMLGAAIDSILYQSHGDLELLIVDDGLDDDARVLIDSKRDARIRVLANAHQPGIVGALATGISEARGPWVARMDADDWSHPMRLERQLSHAETKGMDGVGCRVTLTHPQGQGMQRYVEWTNGLTCPSDFARARFIECPVIHPSSLFRRESARAAGGYREVPWAEDHDLWLRMLENGARFGRVGGESLLRWRDSPQRLTRNDPRYSEAARMAMRCHYLNRLPGVAGKGFVIAGAGPIGKQLVLGLQALGAPLHGILEVNPRRIGQRIHGLPVVEASALNRNWPDAILLGAVGVAGGRARVRTLAEASGREEGLDFWSVC